MQGQVVHAPFLIQGSIKADFHGTISSHATSFTSGIRHEKSRKILKHVSKKPYDNRGLESVVSVGRKEAACDKIVPCKSALIDRLHGTSLPPCWRTTTKDSSLPSTVCSSRLAAMFLSVESLVPLEMGIIDKRSCLRLSHLFMLTSHLYGFTWETRILLISKTEPPE